jgi:superfamily II DNA or RNA helicase
MLFLCAPMRSEVKLRQSAGRLMRKSEGKTSAKIIDFVDVNNGLLANQARKRAKILTNL